MEHVSDRDSNPFGIRYPCDAVPGYGDPSGDFHVVGDNPRVHGGADSHVPFTGSEAGALVQDMLLDVDLLRFTGDEPLVNELFLSYVYPCVGSPTEADYRRMERYFDAELRAVNAHVLVTVGDRATRRVLDSYTGQGRKLKDVSIEELHATEVRGHGFLVVPLKQPVEWTAAERQEAVDRLDAILSRDYRQTKGVATRIG